MKSSEAEKTWLTVAENSGVSLARQRTHSPSSVPVAVASTSTPEPSGVTVASTETSAPSASAIISGPMRDGEGPVCVPVTGRPSP